MSTPTKRIKPSGGLSLQKLPEPALPLHIALAWLMIRAFPINDAGATQTVYSATFVAAIIDIVAREVFDVNPVPATYESLLAMTDPLVRRETAAIALANDKLRSRGQAILSELEEAESYDCWMQAFPRNFCDLADGCVMVDTIEREIRNRISEEGEESIEVIEPLERRSPLGLFFRGLLVSLRKMSFDETTLLSRQIALWCNAEELISLDTYSNRTLNRKLGIDELSQSRVKAITNYQNAASSGDYSDAIASLRRFYDLQLPATGRAQHQHALLNLASFHYMTGGLSSARSAIEEAIHVARAEGDKSCLQECISLSYRLSIETDAAAFPEAQLPRISSIPISKSRLMKAETPMDELWALRAALDLGESVPTAFRRIYSALGKASVYAIGDKRDQLSTAGYLDTSAWHVAQAGLWSLLGSNILAEIHEFLALASSDLDEDSRVTLLLVRADRAAHSGNFNRALAMLVDHSAIEGLSLVDYHRWARSVWGVLEREAKLNGDGGALAVIDGLRPSSELVARLGPGGPFRELSEGPPRDNSRGITLAQDEVITSLRRSRLMLDARTPPHIVFPHVLATLHLSAGLGLWPMYRIGVVYLCEILLAMDGVGLPAKVVNEMMGIWYRLEASGDEETITRGTLVLAKAHAALALDGNDSSIASAVSYADVAVQRAESLGACEIRQEATALRALLAELMGGDLDATIKWRQAVHGDQTSLDERTRRIGDIVRLVGVRVAEGWR